MKENFKFIQYRNFINIFNKEGLVVEQGFVRKPLKPLAPRNKEYNNIEVRPSYYK